MNQHRSTRLRNRKILPVLFLFAGALFRAKAHAAEGFPSLEQAVALAAARAPASVEARGALDVANALGAGARVSSLGNPYVEVIGDRGRYSRDAQIVSALFLPLEVQGQRGARIREWERLVGWKRASQDGVLARTLGDTIAAYGEVNISSARLAKARQAETNAKAEADILEQRLKEGDATLYDLSVARSEWSRWSQTRVSAEVEWIQASARLSELIGRPSARAEIVDVGAPSLRVPLPEEDFTGWLSDSPVLRALKAESLFWEASGARANKEAWSPFSLVVTGGRGDSGEGRIGAGLAWTLPLFRKNQGEIARATAETTRVESVRSSLQAALNERLRGAAQTYRVALLGVRELDQVGIPAAEAAAAGAVTAQKAGKGELARVLIARRDLAAAQARRLDLLRLAWDSYAELAVAKGELP